MLSGPEQGGHICALFVSPRGAITTGRVRSSALQPAPQPTITADEWTGSWKGTEQEIKIKRSGQQLSLVGTATWGAFDPARVARGGVNVGDFTAMVPFGGAELAFTDSQSSTLPYAEGDPGSCRLRLSRRGPYLVVTDNQQCGGQNVTFTGVYRHTPAKPKPK